MSALIGASALAWSFASTDSVAVAFDRAWGVHECVNVRPSSSERGILDDAPGAGAGTEAAYLYVKADNNVEREYCRFRTAYAQSLDIGTNKRLTVRAAVNDGALLTVTAFSDAGCTGTALVIAAIGQGDFPANSSWQAVSVDATQTGIAKSVCIRLMETRTGNVQRISALVDHIRFATTGGTVGWQEEFGKPG